MDIDWLSIPKVRRLVPILLYALIAFAWTLSTALSQGDPPPFQVIPSGSPVGLENLIQLSPRIYSGGEPTLEKSFSALKDLGVNTVVSVDGIAPNIESARSQGLRYVHIPLGYDGVSGNAVLALIRVIREETGVLYFHCHHGRHRGPAAAAIAGIVEGALTTESAKQFLECAGTSPDYAGLWRDVQSFQIPHPLPPLPALHEKAEIASLAQSMAIMDRHWDRLKAFQKNQWNSLPEAPEITPEREALLLAELFQETERGLQADPKKPCFNQELIAMAETFHQLRASLQIKDNQEANQFFLKLANGCRTCHRRHRD